jgi:hypothetical protein
MKNLALVLVALTSLTAFAQNLENRIERQVERLSKLTTAGAVSRLSDYEQRLLSSQLQAALQTLRDNDTTPRPNPDQDNRPYPDYVVLKPGIQVMYNDTIREIMAVGAGETVILKGTSSYYQKNVTRRDVTPLVQVQGNLQVAAQVMYNDTIREILHLDNTNRVVLKGTSSYYQKFVNAHEVSLIVSQYMGLRAGDRVLYNGVIREVLMVAMSGRVVLKGTSSYYQKVVNASELEKMYQ